MNDLKLQFKQISSNKSIMQDGRFDSDYPHTIGPLAQLVEHRIEDPSVRSSNLRGATKNSSVRKQRLAFAVA